ncbi:MAG TPA: cob(I)yrinic acid a,c-diamide adenosyltransferase [Candidatus Magasanikbacteria bacterium]|nr:cob(I)yrinic acid a,c-diamide adenosyltransferase [Candidatus Magasanikbacteria bacterium]
MFKIYTKQGDKGLTGLADGSRISKDDPAIELVGALDELNASFGVARVFTHTWLEPVSKMPRATLESILIALQDDLFYLGALCARGRFQRGFDITQRIEYWEKVIDGIEAQLTPLRHFILPGGSRVAALIHVSRAVCRRTERLAVHIQKQQPDVFPKGVVPFLNRLSDLLFVLARWVNKIRRVPDVEWPLV